MSRYQMFQPSAPWYLRPGQLVPLELSTVAGPHYAEGNRITIRESGLYTILVSTGVMASITARFVLARNGTQIGQFSVLPGDNSIVPFHVTAHFISGDSLTLRCIEGSPCDYLCHLNTSITVLHELDQSVPCVKMPSGNKRDVSGRASVVAVSEDDIASIGQRIETNAAALGVFGSRVDELQQGVFSGLANLAVRQARQEKRLEDLTRRLDIAEAEISDVIEIAPVPLEERLEEVKDAVDLSAEKLGDKQRELDRYAHAIFDACKMLKEPGGYYVLEHLGEDMLKRLGAKGDVEFDLTFEEVVATALRWCDRRSKWYTRRRYWVQSCGRWVIIKHDRFWFTTQRVEQDRRDRAEHLNEGS